MGAIRILIMHVSVFCVTIKFYVLSELINTNIKSSVLSNTST